MAKRVNKQFLIILTAVVLLGAFAGMAATYVLPRLMKKDPKQFVNDSKQAEKDGNVEDAIGKYQAAVGTDQRDPQLRLELGDLYYRHVDADPQNLNKSHQAWESALAVDPTFRPAMERLLDSQWAYMQMVPTAPVFKAVRQAAQRILGVDPKDPKANARIAIVTIREAQAKVPTKAADVEKAVASLRAMSKLEPANADYVLWAAQGDLYLANEAVARLTDTAEAREILAKLETELGDARKGQEKNAAMQLRTAQVYSQLALLDAATSEEGGVALPTTGPSGATSRPSRRAPAGQPAGRFTDRVTAGLTAARENIKPDDELFLEVYSTSYDWLRALGKFDDAKKLIEHVVEVRGEDPAVRLFYARIFHPDPEKRDKIIELLKRKVDYSGADGVAALRLRDMEASMKIELANLNLASLDGEKDQEKRKKVVASVENDLKELEMLAGQQSPQILEIKGRIKLLQGKLVDAITLLQQAVDRNPEARPNFDTRLQLANAYRVNGQTGQSEKLLRSIVARVPDFTPGRAQWVQVLYENGQVEEARDELAKLKKEHPEVKDIPVLEAMVLGGQKRETYVGAMPEATPEDRLRKAVVLRADGKLDEAIELAASAYKADPKFLGALEQLLGMYMQAGRRDEAIAVSKEAIKANPGNKQVEALPDALAKRTPEEFEKWQLERLKQEPDAFARAMGLFAFYLQKSNAAAQVRDGDQQKSNSDQAEKYLAEAERLKPDDVKVLGTRFEFLLQQRRFDEAAPLLKKLAAANADEVNGHLSRFRFAVAKGDLAAAEAAARDMTRSRPQFDLGWQCLGQALQSQGRYREAASAYSSALERKGRSYESIKGLIEVQYLLNDPEEAKHVLDRARVMFPGDITLREMAFNHEMAHGDPNKVIAEREQLLKQNPEVAGNALALAETYIKTLNQLTDQKQIAQIVAKARKVLEDGMKKWPNDARFQWPLARVLLAQDDFLGGEKVLKDYAARDEVKDKAAVDMLLGEYYTLANKPASAEQSYRDALEKTKGAANVKQQLASLLAQTNRIPQAIKLLEPTSKDDPLNNPGPTQQRVRLLAVAGKQEEAQNVLRAAIAANPNSTELSNLQLEMHIDTGRFGDAEQLVRDRLAKNDGDETARYYGALVKLRKNPPDSGGAIKDLVAIADRNPRALNVLQLLADAYRVSGEPGSAIDTLNRALQLQPTNRDVRAKLVEWCAGAGRWDAVIKLATEATQTPRLANDPVWPRALAGAYSATGRFAEADKQITRALSLVPPERAGDIQREQLTILNQGRNYQKVLQLTDGMLAKGRKDWWIYQFRGAAKNGLKDKAGAAKEFETALAGLKPDEQFGAAQAIIRTIAQASGPDVALKRIEAWETNYPRWRITAAELCMSKDDAAAGVTHLTAIEKDVDKLPKELQAEYYRTLGQCYHQSKPRPDFAKAIAAYQKYLEINANDVLALNNLAYVLAEEISPPQPKDAKIYSQRAYDIARNWKPGDGKSRIFDTHGWVLVLNGGTSIDEGVRVLEEVVDEAPLIETHYHLGEAHLQKKRVEDAVEQLNAAQAMIEKAKKEKRPYDEALEPRIQSALSRAKAMSASAAVGGTR